MRVAGRKCFCLFFESLSPAASRRERKKGVDESWREERNAMVCRLHSSFFLHQIIHVNGQCGRAEQC